jgi:hypothetical protein
MQNAVFWDVAPCRSCEFTLCHVPEDSIFHSHRRENLRSYMYKDDWSGDAKRSGHGLLFPNLYGGSDKLSRQSNIQDTKLESLAHYVGVLTSAGEYVVEVPYASSQHCEDCRKVAIFSSLGFRKLRNVTQGLGSRNSDWLRAGRPRGRSLSPGRVKNFLFSTSSRPAVGSTQPPIKWIQEALSPGVKRLWREASAEFKKFWIYTSSLSYAFIG